jgi:hypothetical protein
MALLLNNAFLSLGQPFGEQNLVMLNQNQVKRPTLTWNVQNYVPIQNVDAFLMPLLLKGRWHVH